MSDKRYDPRNHQPATQEEVKLISDDLNFHCASEQVAALTESCNVALGSLKVLDSLSEPLPETRYPRTPGYRPKPEDRFGNAWAWRCDIAGAPSGKLKGKTLAIKDNCAVAGVPMSNGSLLLEGYTPEYDATVVTRILDAGGRILGKASCDDFCLSAMGYSSVDGYIFHPADPDYRVGGSSGGSAVLVAGGQVDLAIGADQGGSIRIPSAWTGTVGLKPTHGLVPYTGLVSLDPTIDHVGPIARNVTDCGLLLEMIAGNDGLDGRQRLNIDVPEYSKLLEVNPSGKKLGVLKEGFDTCVPSTQENVKKFLDTVSQAGLVTANISIPYHKYARDLFVALRNLAWQSSYHLGGSGQFLHGFFPTSLEKAVRQGAECSGKLLSPNVKHATVLGELFRCRYGNHYYCKSKNMIMELSRQYEEAFKHCDVVVMPTATQTTYKFTRQKESSAVSEAAYLKESAGRNANTVAANTTGHPALTLPLGKLGDGHTDSLMIVGRKFDDLTVLQVARALEKIIPARNK